MKLGLLIRGKNINCNSLKISEPERDPLSGQLVALNNESPTEGITTLTQWWGLRGQIILRAIPAVA
jgi:hypothetical protein